MFVEDCVEQLSGFDANWLNTETAQMPMHVGSLAIFGKPEIPLDEVVERFKRHISHHVGDLPLFHRRLDPTSLKMGNPVWVRDPEVDFNYHIKRKTLPAPGTQDQLHEVAVELHKELLDRTRPLWQLTVIDGLENDQFVFYLKMHHAAVDGGAVTGVLDTVFREPEGGVPDKPATKVSKDNAPHMMELMWNSYMNMIKTPAQMLSGMPDMVKSGMETMKSSGMPNMNNMSRSVPKTPFNKALTTGRSIGTVSIPVMEIRSLGKAHDSTINDVVLAVCSGALRRYLAERKELPEAPLVAGLPVSLREDGDTSAKNQITMMTTTLATNVANPIDRLPAIKEAVKVSKETLNWMRPMSRMMMEMPSMGMPMFNNLGQMIERTGMIDKMPPMLNLWISNVPGSRTPYKWGGAEAIHNYPLSIPMHGVALNITLTSYVNSMEFCVIACPTAVPDAQHLADLIGEEFIALKSALSH